MGYSGVESNPCYLAFGPATISQERAPHKVRLTPVRLTSAKINSLGSGIAEVEILTANFTRSHVRKLVARCRGPSPLGRIGDCSTAGPSGPCVPEGNKAPGASAGVASYVRCRPIARSVADCFSFLPAAYPTAEAPFGRSGEKPRRQACSRPRFSIHPSLCGILLVAIGVARSAQAIALRAYESGEHLRFYKS